MSAVPTSFSTAFSMSAALSTSTAPHAGGRGQRDRAGHQHDLSARSLRRLCDSEAHLAGASVADETHRVDALAGGTGGDEHALAHQRASGAVSSATRSMISSGSSMRPSPTSPQACSPAAGPRTRIPRDSSRATLACVAGFAHMTWFMAGATAMGASVARHSVVSRSSAWPVASCARKSALAGATSTSVRPARQLDVAHGGFGRGVPQLAANRAPGHGLEGGGV